METSRSRSRSRSRRLALFPRVKSSQVFAARVEHTFIWRRQNPTKWRNARGRQQGELAAAAVAVADEVADVAAVSAAAAAAGN